MPAIQPTPAVLTRVLDADASIVCLPLPPARLPRSLGDRHLHGSRVLAFPGRTERLGFSSPTSLAAPSLAAPSLGACGIATPRFTTADRLALADWQNCGASGYARVLIEDGRPGTLPDCGAYALVYRSGTSWACWGLTRRLGAAPGIMAWRCATGATLGLYAAMDEALRALPFAGQDSSR